MKTLYLGMVAVVGLLSSGLMTNAMAASQDKGSPQFVMNAIYTGQGSVLTLIKHHRGGHHHGGHHSRGHHRGHFGGGVYVGDPFWHYRLNYPYYQRPGFSLNFDIPLRSRSYSRPNTRQMDCRIKGYVMKNGAHVYFAPNHRDYNKIKMNKRSGDRWFCSEKQAYKAGWRPAS